jgi:hypothetical protein
MTPLDSKEELDLSNDREATVARWYSHDDQLGFIKVESPNGDIDAISRLTRDDAIALIAALQRAFDIPDRAAELELLLEMREETTLNLMEKSVMAGIANIMYENGLKRATITPQNVMSGFVPSLSIDVSVPGVVIYTLNGEPLNGKPDTE